MKTKSNLGMMILSSIICLSPMILALALYNDLPEQIVMQWDVNGNPNWYAPKAAAAFGMPLFFMLLNIIIRIVINKDPRRENHSRIMRAFAVWIIPFISVMVMSFLLLSATGVQIPIYIIVMVFVGIVFIFLGNYMNKNKQNYLIGIRVPWTLNDPDNWNKTHRMAGFLWILGGIIFAIVPFLPLTNSLALIIILSIIVPMVIVPILYSYSLNKKSKNGSINTRQEHSAR
jgi:uncharacterized membrane protein